MAQRRIVVARAAPDARERAEALASALVDALRARGSDAARPAPAVEQATEAPALALARDAYANLRPADARTMLEAMLAHADTTGARGLQRPELLDALLTLSLACRALGDAPAADAALDRALAIDPSLAPSLTQFPPMLVEALATRRAAGAGGGRGAIAIASVPSGARVFVDAQAVAEGGGDLEVAHGVHLLRVEAPGRVDWSARVEVGDARVEAAPELPPDADRLLREPGAAGTGDEQIDQAARALGARAFVLDVSVQGGIVTLRAHDFARARAAAATVAATVPAGEAARELLRRLEPPRRTPPISEPSGGASALPWIVAAGGAVAIAVTIVAIVLATSGSSDPSGFFGTGEIR